MRHSWAFRRTTIYVNVPEIRVLERLSSETLEKCFLRRTVKKKTSDTSGRAEMYQKKCRVELNRGAITAVKCLFGMFAVWFLARFIFPSASGVGVFALRGCVRQLWAKSKGSQPKVRTIKPNQQTMITFQDNCCIIVFILQILWLLCYLNICDVCRQTVGWMDHLLAPKHISGLLNCMFVRRDAFCTHLDRHGPACPRVLINPFPIGHDMFISCKPHSWSLC